MNKLKIPHDAFVFVGDGRKAIFLRNEGDEKFPNLKTEKVIEDDDNPPTHEQGTDKPGALGKAMGSGRRSAVEPADWHDLNEHRFARTVAGAIEQVMRERKVPALVIVAPPRPLSVSSRAAPRARRSSGRCSGGPRLPPESWPSRRA